MSKMMHDQPSAAVPASRDLSMLNPLMDLKGDFKRMRSLLNFLTTHPLILNTEGLEVHL